MPPPPPARPAARPAAAVADGLPLSEAARVLLAPAHTPREFLAAVEAAGLADDAIRFLAAALPKREAVFWACLCGRDDAVTPRDGPLAAALGAAEAWAADPSETRRRQAGEAADRAGYGTAAGIAAAAAFWSGGSLAPAGLSAVPPADGLTAQAVAAAAMLAAAAVPAAVPARKAEVLALGRKVADGLLRPALHARPPGG